MSGQRQKPQQNTSSLTRHAYHEAGHAVVGHVIGRCLSEISIEDAKAPGYHGYCAFDAFAEDMYGFPQWRDGSKNPECTAIMYAGTVALKMLCDQRGWKYERWRGMDQADFDAIYLWSIQMFDQDEQRQTMQKERRLQAQEILSSHWQAVEALASALLKHSWLAGGKAHSIIRESLGETGHDWRLEGGRLLDHSVEYRGPDNE